MNTEILFILDRSGSMGAMRQAAIDGFNRFLKDQQAAPDAARLTLLQFDDSLETPVDAVALPDVPPLDRETFVPRGSTALLDALGTGIDRLGERLAALPEAERPASVIVAILTDGAENSSRLFSWREISDRISHQRDKYAWEFFFLGAGPDAIASAANLNIDAHHSVHYAADSAGITSVKAALSRKVRSSRAMKHGYATDADISDHQKSARELYREEQDKTSPDHPDKP